MKSPITWFGSKSRLAPKMITLFPEHVSYIDVFGGSAAVLFAKDPSPVETYNDLDGRLVNFFRVLRDKRACTELSRMLALTPYARSEFIHCKANPESGDPIEDARRFFVVQRQSYGAHGLCWSYSRNDSKGGMASPVLRFRTGVGRLLEAAERMASVQIENLPFEDILARYDDPDAFFYLDPPYVKETRVCGGYAVEMDSSDHGRMVSILLGIKGKAMLSGFACPQYTPLEEAGWRKETIRMTAYSSDKRAKREECLWMKN